MLLQVLRPLCVPYFVWANTVYQLYYITKAYETCYLSNLIEKCLTDSVMFRTVVCILDTKADCGTLRNKQVQMFVSDSS